MNKFKYFRIKRLTSITGRVIYKVYGCETWIDRMFGNWQEFEKRNDSLEEAIEQTGTIASFKLEKSEIMLEYDYAKFEKMYTKAQKNDI